MTCRRRIRFVPLRRWARTHPLPGPARRAAWHEGCVVQPVEMPSRAIAMRGKRVVGAPQPVRPVEDVFERLVHDLRNPLGVIACFAEAIPTAPVEERDELCGRLVVNAQRALHVLEEFALLAELRGDRSRPMPQTWDAAALVEELATELESMERRPGAIRRRVEVRAPLCLPRSHVACALRALLREALRAASEDGLDLVVRSEGLRVVFQLAVPQHRDADLGIVCRLPTTGIEVELAERVAALYGGRCAIEQLAGRDVITLALPASTT